jgi:trehalose 6-phosphate synthase
MVQSTNQTNNRNASRLVIVSNRLPIVLTSEDNVKWKLSPGSGGLVTALTPILSEKQGLWIGWPGTSAKVKLNELMTRASDDLGYILKPVQLSTEELNQYYLGFSNEILWPLLHDLQSRCNFDPAYWAMYQKVNRKFAEVVAENTKTSDYVWVHDYHLTLVAKELHNMGIKRDIGFFMHTPFPSLDICIKLPWHLQILRSILQYDLIGFQTVRDRNNFLHCVIALLKDLHCDARKRISTIMIEDRRVKVGVFPISIDFNEFVNKAADEKVTKHFNLLNQALHNRKVILGVERLDYSKGIPERLRAFRNALERFSELIGNVTFIQIVVPSRGNVPEYQDLKSEIEQLVSEINGKYTQPGWVPVHYMFRSLKRSELLAYYRAADIALVTPLKDGMNLIAKEYCAANISGKGVLILSRFAGAADQLGRYSLLVNPYDIEGVADMICRAYTMNDNERQLRMRKLRKTIKKRDIFWWANAFLTASVTTSTNSIYSTE